jgi:hypothetical protein
VPKTADHGQTSSSPLFPPRHKRLIKDVPGLQEAQLALTKMAEAVAALGLAANILQMLDYGRKVLSTAWGIYDGTDQTGFTSLQTLCEDLKGSVETLQRPQSEPDEAIAHLAKECSVVANALLQKLQALGLSGKRGIGKREALQAAFQRVWRRNEIQELEDRLNELKSQLVLRLVVSIRYGSVASKCHRGGLGCLPLDQIERCQDLG